MKIEELVEQCGFYITEKNGAALYQFAELIVNECAEVAGCNGHVSGFALGDLIKEHFGLTKQVETCPRCGDEWSGTSCGVPNCGWVIGEDDD